MLRKSWWIILLGPVLGAVLGGLVAWWWVSSMPRLYEAKALIQIERVWDQDVPLAEYVSEMVTIDSLRQVARKLDLAKDWDLEEREVIEILRRRLETGVKLDTDLVEIRGRHQNPEQAQEIVAAFVKSYEKRREREDKDEAEQAVLSLKAAIRNQEAEVEMRKSGMNKYLGKDSKFFEALHNNPHAIDQYHEARLDLETSERLLTNLRADLEIEESREFVPKERVVVHQNPVVGSTPVSPNRLLWIVVGSCVGLVIALPVSLVLGWLLSPGRSPS